MLDQQDCIRLQRLYLTQWYSLGVEILMCHLRSEAGQCCKQNVSGLEYWKRSATYT